MSAEIIGLDRIVEPMRDAVRKYVEHLQQLAGDNVLGLTLYGPIATQSFNSSQQTVRNVLVLKQTDLQMLRSLAQKGAEFGRRHIAAPIVMTPEYINDSLDTFPLELIEIQQLHITVVGDDQFQDLKFEHAHVRLQCERELKTLLIGLRQGLLAAGGREKLLGDLETTAAQTLIRTLRGLLWLKDEKTVIPATDAVTKTEEIIDRKFAGIRVVLDESAEHGWEQFVALYQDLESLRRNVDAW